MTVTTLAHPSIRRTNIRPDGSMLASIRQAPSESDITPGYPINVTIELVLPLQTAGQELSETLDALRAMVEEIVFPHPVLSAGGSRTLAPVGPATHTMPAGAPGPQAQPSEPLVRIFPGERAVRLGRKDIPLSRLEFDLLLFLADHPRQVFTRRQLLESVWGYTQASRRTVDVHVRRLRAKFHPVPLLATVRGVGYRLDSQSVVAVMRHRSAA